MEFNPDKIFDNKYGPFRIIEKLPNEGKNQIVLIEFVNKNIFGKHTTKKCQISNVLYSKNGIKDMYQPIIYNVACKGDILINTPELNKVYNIWINMIKKCYGPKSNIGECVMCAEWLCFENFYKDLRNKSNYDLFINCNYRIVTPPKTKVYDNNSVYIVHSYVHRLISRSTISNDANYKVYLGVNRVSNSDGFTCIVDDMYYGTFTDPIAAANMYNHVVKYRLRSMNIDYSSSSIFNYIFNDVPYMSITEINTYKNKSYSLGGNKLMYRVLDFKENPVKPIAKVDLVNDKIWTCESGDYKIIKDHGVSTSGKSHIVDIQFINKNMYGFNTIRYNVDFSNVRAGNNIRDVYQPSVYGVACVGNAKTNEDTKRNGRWQSTKAYNVWSNMISRCFNVNDSKYNNYGGIGITVCYRWLCFEYFLEDLPSIPNYNEWLNSEGEYQLDKDTLQANIPHNQKIYSKETCMFIPSGLNSLEMHHRNNAKSSGYYGVFMHPSNNYFVRIAKDYYGTFSNKEAAANLYNMLAISRGYGEMYINKLENKMDIHEINKYRIPSHKSNGKYQMYRLVESSNKIFDRPYMRDNDNIIKDVDTNLINFMNKYCKN